MTSSKKHLSYYQEKWDYSLQKYKSIKDVFCEDGLYSILFLACGRSEITRRSFLSTLDCVNKYSGEIEWIFIENGHCEENYQLFHDQKLDRKVIIRQDNAGINEGLNQGWAISRGEFCMIHENDWEARSLIDFFSIARDIFYEKSDIGIIQLRSILDNNEQWGRGKPLYWPWDLDDRKNAQHNVKVWREKTRSGHSYAISNFPNGFNNNPCFIRKQLYRECGPYPEVELGSDPRHGETQMQQIIANSGAMTAHICIDLYYHIGREQTIAN